MNVVALKNQIPEQTQMIPLNRLDPHPQNPRLIERTDVVDAIAKQLVDDGRFNPAHAILVRPLGDRFQIVSGHNRVLAARKAGHEMVPAWVQPMDNETAFMQLVLSNSQSELSPLERGMHALHATQKSKRGDDNIQAYAKKVGRKDRSVLNEVWAAEVAEKFAAGGEFEVLLDFSSHLTEIHAAPSSTWELLVEQMLGQKWSRNDMREKVAQVKAIKEAIPPEHEDWLKVDALTQEHLRGSTNITPQYIAYLIAEAETSQKAIDRALAKFRQSFIDFEEWRERVDSRDLGDCPTGEALLREVNAEHYLEGWSEYGSREILVETNKKNDQETLRHIARPHKEFEELATGQRAAVKIRQQQRENAERKARTIITLTDWKALTAEAQATTMLGCGGGKDQFNKQDGDLIDWAQWSWNPVTGCLHDCPYCYARDIANRFYEQKFEPTLHPGRLAAPFNTKVPQRAEEDFRYKNVFTGSMTDLFGRWVPPEWIEAVLTAARKAPDWNFLFLTKFPQRMSEFKIPKNAWMGTTVDCQARVANAEKAFSKVSCDVRWLSVEPLIEPLKFNRLDLFDWIVIGGASASSKTPEWHPPLTWVADLEAQAAEAGCRVYRKPNLFSQRREMPGDVARSTPVRAPESFHYLGRKTGEVL